MMQEDEKRVPVQRSTNKCYLFPVFFLCYYTTKFSGISTSAMNLAFSVFPLIVARLMTVDPTVYTYVEVFFSCCGFFGFLLAVRLRCLDIHGILDRREIARKPRRRDCDQVES
jgi:hypothetical protein